MFGITHEAIVAKLDKNKDGSLTIADVQAAAAAAKADLKARQTNYYNALVVCVLSLVVGAIAGYNLASRCVPH